MCVYAIRIHRIGNTDERLYNRISGVMVSVLALSAVDRGFEPRSGPIKDNQIGSCCFSTKHDALRM